jgi:uncharacterized protein YjiS (DUF1127 family)
MSSAWNRTSLLTARAERTLVAAISRLASLPQIWIRRLRCRHELSTLSPEQMRDTGLNPKMVEREIRKPFWRA